MGSAIVVRRPGEIGIEERPDLHPGTGQVLVDVAVATICHTDYYVVEGGHPAVSYPVVPGHELSGLVREVGPDVHSVRPGDLVTIQTQLGCHACPECADGRPSDCSHVRQLGSTYDGGWQEYLVIPEECCYRTGELSPTEAALIEPAANGHAAARRAAIAEGDVVVVIGPGPIGLMAVMMSRLRGPRHIFVLGREHDKQRLALARDLGADDTATNHDELQRLVGERGADAVIQCAGSVPATATALGVVCRRGRVVIEGYAGQPGTVPISPDRIGAEQITIVGVNGWTLADFAAALAHAKARRIRLSPLITDRYPLSEYTAALARARDYASGVVKVAFEIGQS